MEERRRFVRVGAPVAVCYKVVDSSATGAVPKTKKDVSVGGMRFTLSKRLEPGTEIELEMTLPGEPAPIRAKGEVVWSARFGKERPYEAGFRFTRIDPLERGKLLHFIHNSLKARRPFSNLGAPDGRKATGRPS